MAPRPRPIALERPALERPESDLVEERRDDPGRVPSLESEVERLLRPRQPRCHAQVDYSAGELLAEHTRLLDATRSEPGTGRGRADGVLCVRAGVRVPDEEQRPQ